MTVKRILRIALSALTLAVCAGMIFSVTSIYLSGVSRRVAEANAALPIFTREIAARYLRYLLPLMGLWLVLSVCAVLLLPAERHKLRRGTVVGNDIARGETAAAGYIRLVLLVAAAALIILGAVNGGLNDVLVKAINICTECIGLG